MKTQILINLAIIGISLTGFAILLDINQDQKKELAQKEQVIQKFWDDKISDHQFLINVTYRDIKQWKGFLNNLDDAYGKMRVLLRQKALDDTEQKELTNFIMTEFAKTSQMKAWDILNRMNINNPDQIFVGSYLEVVERLEKVLNPYFMTKCGPHSYDFDIWEKQTGWRFNAGDTTTLMVRLLKNYDLNSHQTTLIPDKNLKIINPYLGELTVIVPEDAAQGASQEINFKLYNWVTGDTIDQEMRLHPN